MDHLTQTPVALGRNQAISLAILAAAFADAPMPATVPSLDVDVTVRMFDLYLRDRLAFSTRRPTPRSVQFACVGTLWTFTFAPRDGHEVRVWWSSETKDDGVASNGLR